MNNKYLKTGFLTLAILFSLCLSAIDATAQTTKRRRKIRRAPVAAPIQPVAVQNPNYIDGNQIVLGELPTAAPDETTGANNNSTVVPTSLEDRETQIKALNDRIKSLESVNGKEAKQKQLLLNLDILSRAETRAESLRKQLFDIIEKENATQARLQQIQIDSSGQAIERTVALMGSLRPEDLREQRLKSLTAEKTNLESLLAQIQSNRASLETSVQKADALVEKVRARLDKEIDDSLADDKENQ